MSFPGGSDNKDCACNAGDPGSTPGLGRFPGEGNGNLLQCFCLEDSMDREAYWAAVHGVTEYSVHVTKYHRVGLKRKQFVGSQFCNLEVQDQGVTRPMLHLKPPEKGLSLPLLASGGCWWSLACENSSSLCSCLHITLPSACLCFLRGLLVKMQWLS